MIIAVDTFFERQGKERFYTIDDDIITGRGQPGLGPNGVPYHSEVYEDEDEE